MSRSHTPTNTLPRSKALRAFDEFEARLQLEDEEAEARWRERQAKDCQILERCLRRRLVDLGFNHRSVSWLTAVDDKLTFGPLTADRAEALLRFLENVQRTR